MKDIKINKIKANKISEVAIEAEEKVFEEIVSTKNYSIFSGILFAFMLCSMSVYIFMVSSSVFYAVKGAQLAHESENISKTIGNLSILDEDTNKNMGERISYINKDSDTSISLK